MWSALAACSQNYSASVETQAGGVCVCWGWGWVEGAQDRESFRLARDRPGRFLQHPLPSPVPSPTPCSWEAVAYGWGKWKERKP